MASRPVQSRFDFKPYLNFLFTNLLLGEEGQPAFDESQRVLTHALYQDCRRPVTRHELRFTGRNIAHLVAAFPDGDRKTGGRDERHYVEVGRILAQFGADRETVTSGLYHDYTENRLEEELRKDKKQRSHKNPEVIIRSVGEDLQDWLRWNFLASYPDSTQSGLVSAHRARRLVAINYKLTRNPNNTYLDSMQHLLFPVQGIFTLDDVVADFGQLGLDSVVRMVEKGRGRYADMSRRELEHALAKLAMDGAIRQGEAYKARGHLNEKYKPHLNFNDIVRVFLVKIADRMENILSRDKLEQATDVPEMAISPDDAKSVATLRELLEQDPYHAIAAMQVFNESHPGRDMQKDQIAYTVFKNILLANVGKIFILTHYNDMDTFKRVNPLLHNAYDRLMRTTQRQIRATREELKSRDERERNDAIVREYERRGGLDKVTYRSPSAPDDPRRGYYGLDGTIAQYLEWAKKNKRDMEAHRRRPQRLDLDLAAFSRVLDKLRYEERYLLREFTERAEEALYERRPVLRPGA